MNKSVKHTDADKFKRNFKSYEYRVWDSSASLSQADLEATFGKGRHETRTDTYLPPLQNYLPKLRGQTRLELKEKIDKIDGVEVWERSVSADFPVSQPELEQFARCTPNLEYPTEVFQDADSALAYIRDRLATISIEKNRTLYELDIRGKLAAEIELSTVSFKNESHLTLAIECSDLQSALNLASELDLRRSENMSYADWIRKQAGQDNQ